EGHRARGRRRRPSRTSGAWPRRCRLEGWRRRTPGARRMTARPGGQVPKPASPRKTAYHWCYACGMRDDGRRFESLVQSPLRAQLLRFLHAHPGESFDTETLMQTFGRLRLDVENCLREIEAFGAAVRGRGGR